GQCCFVGPNGQRCSARGRLEYHHNGKPFGRGGLTSVENLCLMCHVHNALLAEREYGRAFVRARIARERRAKRNVQRDASRSSSPGPSDERSLHPQLRTADGELQTVCAFSGNESNLIRCDAPRRAER